MKMSGSPFTILPLNGCACLQIDAIIKEQLAVAETAHRQHSLKIRINLTDKSFKKEQDAALIRSKEIDQEIKKWARKTEFVLRQAYDTQEIWDAVAAGKEIPAGGGGADAAWAEVFQSQENQKEKVILFVNFIQ